MAEETTQTKDVPQESKEKPSEAGEGHLDTMLEDIAKSVQEFTKKVVEEAKQAKKTTTGEFAIVGEDKPAAKVADKPADKVADKPADKPADKGEEKPATKLEDKLSEAQKAEIKENAFGKSEGVTEVLSGPLEVATPEERAEVARQYETRGRFALDARLVEDVKAGKLKITTDGKLPADVVEPKEDYVTTARETPDELAKRILGPRATQQQIENYSGSLWGANTDKFTKDADGKLRVAAGETLSIPGQGADGSIITVRELTVDGKTSYNIVKTWNNGASLEIKPDGNGRVSFKDKDRKDAVFEWNKQDLDQNYEQHSVWKTTNRTTGDGYEDGTKRHVDKFGRAVEEQLGPDGPTKIKITDKESNIVELSRGSDGQYHGKRTNHGKVVDADVRMTERGQIYSQTKDKTTGETTATYENGRVEKFDKSDNLKSVDYSDAKGRKFHEEHSPGGDQATSITVTDKDGSVVEFKPDGSKEYIGTKKDAAGNVVQSDLRITGGAKGPRLYTETKEADGPLRKYEDGLLQKLDNNGNVTRVEGTDEFGRKYKAEFNPGQNLPKKYELTLKDGDPPIAFEPNASGELVADKLDANGRKEGTITLRNDTSVKYTDNSGNELKVLYPNGVTVTTKVDAGTGEKTVQEIKGAEVRTLNFDANGNKVKEILTGPQGTTSIETEYDKREKKSEKVTVVNGSDVTVLNYDKTTNSYSGEKVSPGKPNENVSLVNNKLIYRDKATGEVTQVLERKVEEGHVVPTLSKVDYDPNGGTLKTGGGIVEVNRSFSPGRTDISIGGYVIGNSTRGDFSTVAPSGETTVIHGTEKTGAYLKPDGSIQMWDKDGNTKTETLSAVEQDFMKKHADVDKRDIAEIHRRFSPDDKKIDAFYKSLEKIDTADNLTDAERKDLRDNLVRHVAYPQEIYQGKSPTCNVSVVQREMAMNDPERYVNFTVGAVSTGKYTTPSGKEVHFDRNNLKMIDSSGRDLASRVFQAAAVQTVLHPDKVFLNTESGVGEIRSVKSDTVGADGVPKIEYNNDPQAFEGLRAHQVVKATNELTGEVKGGVEYKTADELVALYKANGNKPMTIAVDAREYPFKEVGPVGNGVGLNHVVTITGVDQGPPVKFYIQNQWGLGADRSTPATAILAEDLVNNTTHGGALGGIAIAKVAKNDPNQIYTAKQRGGKVEMSPKCKMHTDSTGKWVCD